VYFVLVLMNDARYAYQHPLVYESIRVAGMWLNSDFRRS